MTKKIKKSKNKKSYYLKDRSLIKFILSHSKKLKIDFSKIKIPSFEDFLSTEKEIPFLDLNKYNIDKGYNETLENKNLPKFQLSTINKFIFEDINNYNNSEYKKNSILFK